MTSLNLIYNNAQPIGSDGDNDNCKPRKSRRTVEPIDWRSANMTTLGPENKRQGKSILKDDKWIAMEEMIPVEEDTIEQKCFHWEIDSWSNLPHEARGPVFEAGGHRWNLLLFPRGNQGFVSRVSVYLELTKAKEACRPNLHACAQYVILVSSMSDPTNYYCKSGQGRFSSYSKDWGFNDFLSHEHLLSFKHDKEHVSVPFLENGRIRFSVIVNVMRDPTGVLWMSDFETHDSSDHTGFVGLRNQGATCYMNSLFQSLYCTNAFRKAIYQIPTDNDNPTDSIALSMQRLFHNLQFSKSAVDTVEVTKSFGWDSFDTSIQQDIQEFNRLLQDELEERMVGTPADGTIRRLFVGRMTNYIRCINVDYRSNHPEDYYDIQLNVKGCKDLEESFKDYMAEETMDGDNKYMAGDYGLQDAKKRVTFESFPPVLHLQLKRFEHDRRLNAMVKINDRYEFPLKIDLEPYLSPTADRSSSHAYALHGVLVHSGNVSSGHYFAFIRPTKDETWLKFDDERVTRATLDDVLEHSYGKRTSFGYLNSQSFQPPSNAYMLVYIRECMEDDILDAVDDCDIPRHLWKRLKGEETRWQEAQGRRETQPIDLNAKVYPSSSFLINKQCGIINERHPGPMAMSMSVPKNDFYHDFKNSIAESFALSPSKIKLWSLITRCNKTFRVDRCIEDVANSNTRVDDLMQYMSGDSLSLYVERTEEFELIPSATTYPWLYTVDYDGDKEDQNDDIIGFSKDTLSTQPKEDNRMFLFVKSFIPENQELCGQGTMYAYKHQKIESVLDCIRCLTRFSFTTPLALYKEESPYTVKALQTDSTFEESDIETGDIICVQKQLSEQEMEHMRERGMWPTAREYITYLADHINVLFKPHSGQEQQLPAIMLRLLYTTSYEEIVEELGYHASMDSNHVLLYRPGYAKRETPWVAVRRYEGCTLEDLLTFADRQQPCLGYQLLDVALDEYESYREISVIVCKENLASSNMHTVKLTIAQSLSFRELWDKITLETNHDLAKYTGNMCFVVGIRHRFYEAFTMDDLNAYVPEGDKYQIYTEPIPEDEQNVDPDNTWIPVFHYDGDIRRTHSVPFQLLIKKGELFSDTKKRLQARTGLTNEEWGRVKCFFIQDDFVIEELQDNDELSDRPYTPLHDTAIGLDHPEKIIKRIYQRPLRIQG